MIDTPVAAVAQFVNDPCGAVGRAVVDPQAFPVEPGAIQCLGNFPRQRGNLLLLIFNRNDNAYIHRKAPKTKG